METQFQLGWLLVYTFSDLLLNFDMSWPVSIIQYINFNVYNKIYWQIHKSLYTLKAQYSSLYCILHTIQFSILKHLHSNITALEEVTGIIANFLPFSFIRAK